MPPSAAGGTVTASDLARHFGHWQRRALKAPVYVLNHGRAQFVLASVEFMQALSATRPLPDGGEMGELLDALIDPVLLCDSEATVLAAGRAARLCFGIAAQSGAHFGDFLPAASAATLGAVVARVAATRLVERLELPTSTTRLEIVVEPATDGVVIVARAAGVADARDSALAQAAALASALTALPGHAIATINPLWLLVDVDRSLERLTGLSQPALARAPATSLFSSSTRIAVRDALEAIFGDDNIAPIEAELLTADGDLLPVTVALAALRRGAAVDAVQAVISRRLPTE